MRSTEETMSMRVGREALFQSKAELARLIDHTLLNSDAGPDGVRNLCAEAQRYGFVH